MTTEKIERQDWPARCDAITKGLSGQRAEIEVASLAMGSQIAAEWLPFYGIAYDPREDMIEIALEGLDHLIAYPQHFAIERSAAGLTAFEIIDADGQRQIVKLRDPVALPAPSA